MPDEITKLNRKSIRLPNYDNTQEGAYFITLITHNRECLFGNVDQDKIHLTTLGEIIEEIWQSIPLHFPNVSVDPYLIMPNHIHGIIVMN